jgi:hypothetical protein
MITADNSPESPKKPDPSAAPPTPETNGQNGASERKYGVWPFDGPQPYKLTPEELEWTLQQFSREDTLAGLREIEETGGFSSEEFLRTVEQAAKDDG